MIQRNNHVLQYLFQGQMIDEDVSKLRESLFEDKICKKLGSSNIESYSLSWGHTGINPEVHEEDKQYLDKFCGDFISDCSAMIEKAGPVNAIPINTSNYYTDYHETIHHLKFCLTKCESFFGQEDVCTLKITLNY